MAAHASHRCKAGRAPRICLLFNVGLESKKVEEEREKKRVGRAKVLRAGPWVSRKNGNQSIRSRCWKFELLLSALYAV